MIHWLSEDFASWLKAEWDPKNISGNDSAAARNNALSDETI
jgi:hypothetical protein